MRTLSVIRTSLAALTFQSWYVLNFHRDRPPLTILPLQQLKVDAPEEVQGADDDEDDISDPEEDTLAGQMAALKGQKVKRSTADGDDDSSSDEDDDKDDGDDSSDTDGEAPKRRQVANDSSDSDSD